MADETIITPTPEETAAIAPKGKAGPSKYKKTGSYTFPCGLELTSVKVFVVSEIKDGLADLSRTKDGEPFVRSCPHADEPTDGHWTTD